MYDFLLSESYKYPYWVSKMTCTIVIYRIYSQAQVHIVYKCDTALYIVNSNIAQNNSPNVENIILYLFIYEGNARQKLTNLIRLSSFVPIHVKFD